MLQKKPEEGYGEGDFKTFPQISYLQRVPSYETKKTKKGRETIQRKMDKGYKEAIYKKRFK